MTWKIDRDGMIAAMKYLGVKHRVKVGRVRQLDPGTAGRQRTGEHHDSGEIAYHEIQLLDGLSVEEANEVLLHELVHCRQREQTPAGVDYDDLYFAFDYEDNPFEAEAFGVAAQHRHILHPVVAS